MQLKPETPYNFTNSQVIGILKEALAAMEIKGANIFKIRAYQNAISSIESITNSVYDLWQNNQLDQIPGMGVSLKSHIDELFRTGKVLEFEALKKDLPAGMFALIGIKGVGAKTAYKLATAFKLNDPSCAIEKVKEAAKQGKIQLLEGFGPKKEADILRAIEQDLLNKNVQKRLLLPQAEQICERIVTYLQKNKYVQAIYPLGSLRRRAATIGDLDFAVVSENPFEVIEHFALYDEIDEIIAKGDKKVSVRLKNSTQVDIRVCESKILGTMMQYFTGSKQHNVLLRSFALEKGMSLSEYSIKSGDKEFCFSKEEDVYNFIGLSFIPPEIRSGKDEIDFALQNKIPNLIQVEDIRGDLHAHTIFSDGVDDIKSMVLAAKNLGYEYIGISDHAPSIETRGESNVLDIIKRTKDDIEQINSSNIGIRVLFGYEVNILSDGRLSMPDKLLEILDYVIASVHTSFDQERSVATKRVLEALKNPFVRILGHPSGRLINKRNPMDLDWERVFESCLENKKILEINSQPDRLDLPDDLVYMAQKKGISFVINTDAHSAPSLSYIKYGVDVARRGWLTNQSVINTKPLKDLTSILRIKV